MPKAAIAAAHNTVAPVVMRRVAELNLITEAPDDIRAKYQVRKASNKMSMEELIASIRHCGVVFDLIVYVGQYVVAGNRRLTALRIIHPDGEWSVRTQDVEAYGGDPREIALATNVGLPMHPVDKYEIIASLVADGHQPSDVAAHYGLEPRQYDQIMKLASLSPAIRDAWRNAEIRADVAQAFTLTDDKAQQEKLLKSLRKEYGESQIQPFAVRRHLVPEKLRSAGKFVAFVGPEVLRNAGCVVSEDLFGDDHTVSDLKLLHKLVDEKVEFVVRELTAPTGKDPTFFGWSWAARRDTIQNPYSYGDMAKPYTGERKSKAGVFIKIMDDGSIEYDVGKVRPEDKAKAAAKPKVGATKAKGKKSAPAAPAVISIALGDRLALSLRAATQEALKIVGKSSGGLTGVLAEIVSTQLEHSMTVQDKAKLIRAELPAKTFNATLAKHFDATDYFSNAPKGMQLAAIRDVGLFNQAKGIVKRAELAKFCVKNVAPTGWLPRELRTPHYSAPLPKQRR